MYDKIVNPLTGRYVSVKGTIGKTVLKNYLKQLGGATSPGIYSQEKDGYIFDERSVQLGTNYDDVNIYDEKGTMSVFDQSKFGRTNRSTKAINYINNQSGAQPYFYKEKYDTIFNNIRNLTKKIGEYGTYGEIVKG